jgi:hypothetical protein
MLECDWLHSVWTKSLVCKDVFLIGIPLFKSMSEVSALFARQKSQFPTSRPEDVSSCPDAQLSKAPAVRTMCHTVRTHIRLKHHLSGRRGFSSGPSSVSRSFELLQLASVRTFQQPVRTTLSVWTSFRFSFQVPIKEDWFNCPDDVNSHPDALIHKASIAIQIQPSGRQSAWSGRACIRYGNCVHQISRPDDHPPGPDARSLYMEITCSGCETVRTWLSNRKDLQRNFWNFGHTVIRPDDLWPPFGWCSYLSWQSPFEPLAYK